MSTSGGGTPAVPTGPAGGDLSGGYPAPVVSQVQGRPVSNAAPAGSQAFVWNGALWLPSAIVNNFAGRTGGIVPTTGDYTAAQVTNAADTSAAGGVSFAGKVGTAGQTAASGPILGGGQRGNASGVTAAVIGIGTANAGIQLDDGTINWQIDNNAEILRFFITGTLIASLNTIGDYATNGAVSCNGGGSSNNDGLTVRAYAGGGKNIISCLDTAGVLRAGFGPDGTPFTTNHAAAATAGAAVLPANPAGFLVFNLLGTGNVKVPYYNV